MGDVYDLTNNIPEPSEIKAGDILNCPYSGTSISISLPAGNYKLECWGAQGGGWTNNIGGNGGYSTGILTLSAQNTILYLYTGGQGYETIASAGPEGGGFNGGGNGNWAGGTLSGSGNLTGCGGGGASDIRIGTDSLYARVIVAGGGGGAGYYSSSVSGSGGVGGGTSGGAGTNTSSSYKPGNGGTATAAGDCYSGTTSNSTTYFTLGSFGQGASAEAGTDCLEGGGGGWYGGGGSQRAGGGGGSGYVYTSSTASNYPSGCLLNSNYYLTSASTIIGSNSFTDYDGTTTITGHAGDGFIKIIVISANDSTTYNLTSSIPAASLIKTNDVLNCPYSGSSKTLTLSKGIYKLECWGAQGGSYDETYLGGKGGYASGILTLSDTTTLYLYAGGQGSKYTTTSALGGGGFNGGGNAYSTSSYYGIGGGGASDIRIGTDSPYSRVIVAGGGGAAGYYSADQSGSGGYGGGSIGGEGTSSSTSYNPGTGGTQTAIGITYNGTTEATNSSTDSFGGGVHFNGGVCGNGGGGGWYGGGGSRRGGAGGGSGYTYTSLTAANYPSDCTLNSNYYLGSDILRGGNESFLNTSGIMFLGQIGNGYVRITSIITYVEVTIPTISNTTKTYNASSQSPTETNYNSTYVTRSGVFNATLPGLYTVTYSLKKPDYIWSDNTFEPKVYTWQINSNWKKVQPWIYDSTL